MGRGVGVHAELEIGLAVDRVGALEGVREGGGRTETKRNLQKKAYNKTSEISITGIVRGKKIKITASNNTPRDKSGPVRIAKGLK